jgi:6-phosphogluconate dehydrogenase
MTADIGLIGLAVMGQNLVLNMNDHGFTVAVYNRTVSKVDEFLEGPAKGTDVIGVHSIPDLIAQLKRPRRIMLMVKAGEPVDSFILQCLPYLEEGDILIDGGNSLFTDTNRRCRELAEKGVIFIGTGISGGEEGARYGPSIMPGGNRAGWPHVKDIFQAISAKVDGEPCCDWVGDEGAGHYVKMIHNGIEYGDMQLIGEAYFLLRQLLKTSYEELKDIFAEWNRGELNSYLIEITSAIFGIKDEDQKTALLENILDVAGQKGTGKWTVENALDLGMPLTLIGEAVFARCLSALKEERMLASVVLQGTDAQFDGDHQEFIEHVRQGLYASKIISYAQGFMLMQQAAKDYQWQFNYGSIALMWRGGCIIRSQFLGKIKEAFNKNPELKNLLLDAYFSKQIQEGQLGWRKAVSAAAEFGVPAPCFSTALAFYDGLRTAQLPANLLQAQRDFFGAHTYERVDRPRGEFFHTNWTGTGGDVSSGSYNA